MAELTARKVATITKPGHYADGGNLYLQVSQGEGGKVSKSWVFRYKRHGKAREMGLGPVHTVFRDWAAETTGHPSEVVEMALAHTIKDKAEAAYRRGDLLAKRRKLMQEWADYCWPKQ